jgi:hypothetical protein
MHLASPTGPAYAEVSSEIMKRSFAATRFQLRPRNSQANTGYCILPICIAQGVHDLRGLLHPRQLSCPCLIRQ